MLNRFRRGNKPIEQVASSEDDDSDEDESVEEEEKQSFNLKKNTNKKKSKKKTAASSDESEDDDDESDGASILSPTKKKKSSSGGGLLSKFRKTRKKKKTGSEEDSDDSDGDIEMAAMGKSKAKTPKKKTLISNNDDNESLMARIEYKDYQLPASRYDSKHKLIRYGLILLLFTALLAGEVICLYRNSCWVAGTIEEEDLDPAVPKGPAQGIVPMLCVMVFVVVPYGFVATLGENKRSVLLWSILSALLTSWFILLCIIYFIHAGKASKDAAVIWATSNDMTMKSYYGNKDTFATRLGRNNLAFAMFSLIAAIILSFLTIVSFSLARMIKNDSDRDISNSQLLHANDDSDDDEDI